MKKICAFAPATIANANVGFDCLGIALNNIGDKVEVAFNDQPVNRILSIEGGDNLPMDAEKNCCSVVIRQMQRKLGSKKRVDIRIEKGFASGSGLGSSSASSAAAAVAYNELAGKPFSREQLIEFAAEGERAACGAPHKDNVAPALLGGIVLMQENRALSLPVPDSLFVLSVFPKITLRTKDSRNALDSHIPHSMLALQTASMGAFVSSLYQNDMNLLSRSMKDYIVEPARKKLIPYFDEMKIIAHENLALSFGISGSGPSVFMLCQTRKNAQLLSGLLKEFLMQRRIASESYITDLKASVGAYLCAPISSSSELKI
ncbi:MAG: homoserine kinase [Cytophagales bacterium]|nr:homoserine kinase [Cytophagales bacterium]